MTTTRLALRLVVSMLGLFTAARLALLLGYYDAHFSALPWPTIALALLEGVRFDASVLATFVGLPLLLLLSPVPRSWRTPWQASWLWLVRAVGAAMICLLAADVLYYGYVKRHMFDEIIQVSADLSFVFDMAFQGFLPHTMAFVGAVISLVWFAARRDRLPYAYGPRPWLQASLGLLVLGAAVRGSFGLKPLNIPDAFRHGDPARADLILNGAFTAWHASRNSKQLQVPRLPAAEERQVLTHLGFDPAADFPFLRDLSAANPSALATPVAESTMATARPYRNVVIILLESWFNHYLDVFGKNNFAVTPHFDAMAREGLRFPNFFANGTRSIEAIQAVLTSLPATPGQPHLGLGLEMLVRTGLGQVARQNSVTTMFAQSGLRDSFRLQAIAGALGFQQYYGAEDYPMVLNYGDGPPPAFGYDYEMLQFMREKFDAASEPFCAFMFTGTTHTPFILPPIRRANAHDDPEGEHGFLNTLYYSDAAIGAFFQAAAKSSWFQDTLFVFTGDHTFPKYGDFALPELYRVPLVIWSPRMQQGAEVPTYGSHVDILPTVAHLAGWQGSMTTVGQNLLAIDRDAGRAFIPARSGNTVWLETKGFVRLQGDTLLKHSEPTTDCSVTCFDGMRRQAMSLLGLITDSLQKNRWQAATLRSPMPDP